MNSQGRVLIIAGSDSGGGAGIQGDIKTVTCLGGYAATAITALTAQNTQGVFAIHDVPCEFIARQITLVLDDIGADTLKTGMLHRADIITTVADTIRPYGLPLVLDPVMFAKGGAALLQPDALDMLKTHLVPLAHLLTPNIPEAEYLSGVTITSLADMHKAMEQLLKLGCKAVLLKGGHMPGDNVTDLLYDGTYVETFSHAKLTSPHTHGTGCSLASAIATGLAQQLSLRDSVMRAREYVYQAILHAPGLGQGHGPLGHNYAIASAGHA